MDEDEDYYTSEEELSKSDVGSIAPNQDNLNDKFKKAKKQAKN
jgi:hypothetical protein